MFEEIELRKIWISMVEIFFMHLKCMTMFTTMTIYTSLTQPFAALGFFCTFLYFQPLENMLRAVFNETKCLPFSILDLYIIQLATLPCPWGLVAQKDHLTMADFSQNPNF